MPTILGLNASLGTGRSESFSAQLASGQGIFTSLNLLNTSELPRQVTLSAVGDDGQLLAPPVVITLSPREVMLRDAADLFQFGAGPAGSGGVVEGSVRVQADGDGVIGDVVFGASQDLRYAAALSLQDRRFRRAVFSQVANTPTLFTGLALFNPEAEAAMVGIEVFGRDGATTGSTVITLEPGQRISQLLPQLVPESAGQQGGYIAVTSNRPIVAQQLFGTFRLSLLSAVPPTVVE